jgi:hypothetical protein
LHGQESDSLGKDASSEGTSRAGPGKGVNQDSGKGRTQGEGIRAAIEGHVQAGFRLR